MNNEQASARAKRIEEMRALPLNGQIYKRMIEAGFIWLRTNQDAV